jgi:hypothetical protein
MSTTHNRKKFITTAVGAVFTGAAASAMLFAGAGTAQAIVAVSTTTDALGVTVHVHSVTPKRSWELCSYDAVPVPGSGKGIVDPLPVFGVPFYLQKGGKHDLWFPGIQTESTWDVTVKCSKGEPVTRTQVKY